MDYTVLMLNYNHNNRIPIAIDYWQKQKVPPKRIVIMDNGSDETPDIKGADTFAFPNSNSIGKIINRSVDEIDTEIFICSDSSVLVPKEYMEIALSRHKPNVRNCGVMVRVHTPYNLPEIIYKPAFILKTADPRITPVSIYVECKETFLYYNEAFEGYGYEDVDYYWRWMSIGNEIYRNSDLIFYHWEHPKIGKFYNPNHNKELHEQLIEIYKEKKMVPDFSKKGNRCFIPEKFQLVP